MYRKIANIQYVFKGCGIIVLINICRSSVRQHFIRNITNVDQVSLFHFKIYHHHWHYNFLIYLIKCHPGCIVCKMPFIFSLFFLFFLYMNILISMRFSLLIESQITANHMLNPILIVSRLKRFKLSGIGHSQDRFIGDVPVFLCFNICDRITYFGKNER